MSGGHLTPELLRGERPRSGADSGVKGSFECHLGGAVRLGGAGGRLRGGSAAVATGGEVHSSGRPSGLGRCG